MIWDSPPRGPAGKGGELPAPRHAAAGLPDLPAPLDLGMTAGRQRQRPATPQLLGKYPVPALHLVGAGLQPGPRAPSRWRPGSSPMQHGIDYTFAHRYGLVPVRWRPETVITVRLTSDVGSLPPVKRPADAVDAVVAELRGLTGLDLRSGQPLTQLIDIRRVPEQEVHVACLPSLAAWQARRLAGNKIPSGGAVPALDRAWYQRGWAIVDTDLTTEALPPPDDPSVSSPAVFSVTGLAVLRHQLCHALGLGHAARRRALMHQQIPVDLDGYSPGDRYGLAMLGNTRPVPHTPPPPSPAHERTIPCC